jgi:hypothetical protein
MNRPSGSGGGGGPASVTGTEPPKNVFAFISVLGAGMVFGTRSAHLSCLGESATTLDDIPAISAKGRHPLNTDTK